MTHPLDKDIQAYSKMLDDLRLHHRGKFGLFHDGAFIDAYDTFDTAAGFAVKRFGKGPYLIRAVGNSSEMRMPASVAYRPLRADC